MQSYSWVYPPLTNLFCFHGIVLHIKKLCYLLPLKRLVFNVQLLIFLRGTNLGPINKMLLFRKVCWYLIFGVIVCTEWSRWWIYSLIFSQDNAWVVCHICLPWVQQSHSSEHGTRGQEMVDTHHYHTIPFCILCL